LLRLLQAALAAYDVKVQHLRGSLEVRCMCVKRARLFWLRARLVRWHAGRGWTQAVLEWRRAPLWRHVEKDQSE